MKTVMLTYTSAWILSSSQSVSIRAITHVTAHCVSTQTGKFTHFFSTLIYIWKNNVCRHVRIPLHWFRSPNTHCYYYYIPYQWYDTRQRNLWQCQHYLYERSTTIRLLMMSHPSVFFPRKITWCFSVFCQRQQPAHLCDITLNLLRENLCETEFESDILLVHECANCFAHCLCSFVDSPVNGTCQNSLLK